MCIRDRVIHYSNSYGDKKFSTELAKLIYIAKSKRIKVFIIAPVPTYDVHIPQTMFYDAGNKEALSLTRERHLDKTQTFQKFVDSFKNSEIEVYDPSEFLCNSEVGCLISTVDSKPYYFDSNHLTLTGASLLKPLFDRLLSRI